MTCERPARGYQLDRHKTCAAPGCERPIGWTQAHHVEFWSQGGETNSHRLVPLCYYHHRPVHEGGWQVVLAGERVDFVPPHLWRGVGRSPTEGIAA